MSEKRWFEARMLAYAAGLVEDDEVERFETLREADQECGRAWSEFMAGEEPAADFHIPPGMIAHWPKAASRLGDLERHAVEAHLARCGSCAEEVDLFGSEGRPASRILEPRRTKTHTPRRDPWRIALSSGLVGAMAAAAVLLLWMQPPVQEPETDGALPWAAPTRVRSDELPSFARVVVGPDTHEIGLSLAVPQSIDRFRPAEIAVVGPDGALIRRFEAPAAQLGRGALVLLIRSDLAFAAGGHLVRISQTGLESDVELWFDVELNAD